MMEILPQLQPEASRLVPLLVDALQHESSRVRGKSAESLGKLGPAAHEASLELLKLTQDEWFNVREAASNALRRIQQAPR
jgi:HEAT repeat protein